MADKIRAYAAAGVGKPLKPIKYDPGELGYEEVEIEVSHCGLCHSDLSMLLDDWRRTTFPLVPGHEVVGVIVEAGPHAKHVKVGQRVGLGWVAGSCTSCLQCLSGNHHLCELAEETIVGRHGGFAERVRCRWEWALPIPDPIASEQAGPLFCGGLTVFSPLVEFGVKPLDRVAVVGIGGLGHLALQFLNKWGCEVWAMTSSDSKRDEAVRFGAHHVVNSRDPEQLKKIAGVLHFMLVTANVPLNWPALLASLAPRGRMHLVGAVLEPMSIPAFSLIGGQKSVSGSPTGSPVTLARMLEFCARHRVVPQVEVFPMSKVNEALAHLQSGKARYRVVLQN